MEHPAAEPAPGEAKPGEAEAPKPAEAQPAAEPVAQVATPQAVEEWMTKDPAFKAALDASPALKSQIMETARQAAAAAPVLEIVPTREEAEYAVETANRFTGLRSDFMLSVENPDLGEQAWGNFVDLFKVTDAEGKPMLDANGQPKLGEDFNFIAQKFTTGALSDAAQQYESKYQALKQRVETGVYPNEAAREADRAALQTAEYSHAAYKFVLEDLAKEADPVGALPQLPADATPEQKAFQAKLQEQHDALNKDRQTSSKAGRVQARQQFETKMNQAWGAGIGEQLDNWMKAAEARGEFIPRVVLEQKWVDPTTGKPTNVSNFAAQVAIEFKAKTNSIGTVFKKLRDLESLPPGPQAEAARAAYYADLRTKYLGPIIEKHVKRIQDGIREQAAAVNSKTEDVVKVARVEPQTGGGASSKTLTGAQLEAEARKLAEADPSWAQSSERERVSLLIQAKTRLQMGA